MVVKKIKKRKGKIKKGKEYEITEMLKTVRLQMLRMQVAIHIKHAMAFSPTYTSFLNFARENSSCFQS